MSSHNIYQTPLTSRYSSDEMKFNFSDQNKFSTWRRLWFVLAKGEKEFGLNITNEQLKEMEENIDNIDFDFAAKKEKELRHDVMAHIHTFGMAAPKAMPIIHLGATSCFVGDNTDLILIKKGLEIILQILRRCVFRLYNLAKKYKDLPCLGYTHLQAAQLITVGKRFTMWLQDLIIDYNNLKEFHKSIPFRGIKGTTGTLASFMELFNNDYEKVKKLNEFIMKQFNFEKSFIVTGQTYTRKIDVELISRLSSLGSSLHRIATDIRLWISFKEVDEPFETNQVGSSAMPYKRNPIRCERICSLAKHLMILVNDATFTLGTQWMERTLDDSANRRISIPESFLTADACLITLQNVLERFVVHPKMIERRINDELPFMASEVIIMEMVKNGADRQECHENLRQLSGIAGAKVKEEGKDNNLIQLISQTEYFSPIHQRLPTLLNPKKFIGACELIVDDFLETEVQPIISEHSSDIANKVFLNI
ncbi:hypothetical protein SNEBB_004881 [Seison nebaliae]|nr:hypothetical protein SNEBB_004881 [Seison nebaliae]